MKKLFLKFRYLLLAIVMVIACYVYAVAVGDEYLCVIENVPESSDGTAPVECIEDDGKDTLEIVYSRVEGSTAYVKVRSKNPGRAYVSMVSGEASSSLAVIYIHRNGVITADDYFGDFTGSYIARIGLAIYLAILLADLIIMYRRSIRRNLYLSRNILTCGLIIFIAGSFLMHLINLFLFHRMGLYEILGSFMNFLQSFAIFTMPVAVIMAVLATISNIRLLQKEGRTWRNTLAIILSLLLFIATVTPVNVSYFLQNSTLIDVHQWTGTGRFIGLFIENTAGIVVVYFECILAGTIILSIRAARHIPAFDKDYIIIHGCQIRKDGTLTKLLQSRADRAIEFAEMQKKATGKDIIFIPSGGKGTDEVISEAQAIANYLLSIGIPESSIILEDKSTNTYENFRNSMEIIKASGKKAPKIAFATTNYHVFRAGLLATRLKMKAEGIGSKTKSYFWVNAFIREFIATVYYKLRTHILVLSVLMLINVMVTLMTYISNVVLSGM
ncbi:MAG: YdcF family protein [Lachnospiraceae bacterium]|nr:YdcF family protein [Lachnospiraceae bacterium]